MSCPLSFQNTEGHATSFSILDNVANGSWPFMNSGFILSTSSEVRLVKKQKGGQLNGGLCHENFISKQDIFAIALPFSSSHFKFFLAASIMKDIVLSFGRNLCKEANPQSQVRSIFRFNISMLG